MARIRLELEHNTFTAGNPICGVVTFETGAGITVSGLGVRLRGIEEIKQSAQLTRLAGASREFLRAEDVLAGRAGLESAASHLSDTWNLLMGRISHVRLDPGVTHYPFALSIPPNAAQTYNGEAISTRYVLSAHADLPFRRDITCSTEVLILPSPRSEEPHPASVSHPSGEEPTGAYLSAQVQSDRLQTGGTISGSVTLQNPNGSQLEGLTAALVCREIVNTPSGVVEVSSVEAARSEIIIPNFSGLDNENVFSISIPEESPPSLEGRLVALKWYLRLETNPPGLAELEIPLTLYAHQ